MMNGCLENETYKERFFREKLIAILRGTEQEQLPGIISALKKGGISLVEIPFDQTRPPEHTTEKIKMVLTYFSRESVLCGAGTVLSPEQVQACLLYTSPRKGCLRIGADADFAIVDMGREWIVDGGKLYYKQKWSPYDGWKIKGAVDKTIVRGKIVYDSGRILAEKGYGRFINPREISEESL